MKISLSSKVFAAVLALCAFAVLSMGMAAYLSFTHGFLGYLNEQAIERMEGMLPRFERAYAEHGDWHFAEHQREAWFELLKPERPRDADPRQPILSVSDLTGAFLRLTLLDANQAFVNGYRDYAGQPVLREIRVAGQVVGYLALTPIETVTATGDQRFQAAQVHSSLAIGLVCLLVSAFIAWWIARALLRPVRRVAAATHRLAAGDYAIQVPVTSADEVGQLAHDFNRMAEAMAATEQQRRTFLADISHELRTPLAVMRGELEALEDGIRPVNAAALQSLQAEVASLNKLVEDLYELSLSEFGGPTYRFDPVDLALLLQVTVDAHAARFAERRLTLELALPDAPLLVRGDEQRLTQLLHNLLENSLRYTDPGGQVRLAGVHEGGQVVLHCQDSAPGVPDAQQTRLFERFYRTEASRSRASGGAGLGLAICRGIVEVHGGSLSARSSPLGGVWLTVRLPALQESPT